MLDVYELCTPDLQEKMVSYRSKFKDLEDKKVNQQPKNVSLTAFSWAVCSDMSFICSAFKQIRALILWAKALHVFF